MNRNHDTNLWLCIIESLSNASFAVIINTQWALWNRVSSCYALAYIEKIHVGFLLLADGPQVKEHSRKKLNCLTRRTLYRERKSCFFCTAIIISLKQKRPPDEIRVCKSAWWWGKFIHVTRITTLYPHIFYSFRQLAWLVYDKSAWKK